jgi:hypothetical protein
MDMDLAQTPRNALAPYLCGAGRQACMKFLPLQSIAVCCNAVWQKRRHDSANKGTMNPGSPTKDFAHPHVAMGWQR